MKRKKRGRPAKKKVTTQEPFEEIILQEETPVADDIISTPQEGSLTFCECGKEAHSGSHQCWGCAHRA